MDFIENCFCFQSAQAVASISDIGLNQYAIYLDCEDESRGSAAERYRADMQTLIKNLDPAHRKIVNEKVSAGIYLV